ncbi:hypothetical protein IGI52_003736 [Enterococcus sp. DIV0187]
MRFKKIVIFSIREFNDNKEKDGVLPQDGIVINTMVNASTFTTHVSVGYP